MFCIWQENNICARVDSIQLGINGQYIPTDCASWLLRREADRPINVFEALTGLLPLLTGREPPLEESLDWLQFTYTKDRAGAYVAPASTVLVQSAVMEGDELSLAFYRNLWKIYPRAYANSTLGPGPDYPFALTGRYLGIS